MAKRIVDPYRVVNVLRTESKTESNKIYDDICQDIGPVDFFERIKVQDIAVHIWNKIRYRRIRNALFESALSAALRRVLFRVSFPGLPSKCVKLLWDIQDAQKHICYQ